ncbi:MAG TPA: UDP-N-acetylglucosamine 4,6-dehydratase (inverting) [Opitutae bacterium]|nr:UDP-N-acetylglucosamine 4,6-dehydratase (inverting) [Opitutae bacterium]
MLNGHDILITGATGSFGRRCCLEILKRYAPKRLIVFSRDELKQSEMQSDPAFQHPAMRFFLGDVRDKERLKKAMAGVDYAIHAAALKQVPAAEYNPHEFIKTNINGAMNVVDAAIDAGVKKVIALSTDKAVNPVNLYGATKLCSDKIFVAANSYSGKNPTRFSVVRYGNVVGSRGSVLPCFYKQRNTGTITVTDLAMTRFLITLRESVDFVLNAMSQMMGGEIFVPKLPSCTLKEMAQAVAPDCKQETIGLRPGEKMHETLIPADEAHLTLEFDEHFIIQPMLPFWQSEATNLGGRTCKTGFSYASNNNKQRLSRQALQDMCEEIGIPTEVSPESARFEPASCAN